MTGAGPGTGVRRGRAWANWAGNQRCLPHAIEHPRSEADLIAVVRRAGAEGRRVKAVGAGHSFTSAACTDGYLLDLRGYDQPVAIDPVRRRITVQAGMRLARLGDLLAEHGMAMENLGDVAYQSVAGAIATATHGTGARFPNLSAAVVGLRLITGGGEVVDCSAEVEPELWSAARVGLGALGLVSTVTLAAVPAFNLHTVEEVRPLDEVLAGLDAAVEGNDHFEFFWFPNTPWALTKRHRRTADAPRPRTRLAAWASDQLVSNYVFGATCWAATRAPAAARLIGGALGRSRRAEYTDRSDRVFASPRKVRFVEMEYAVARDDFASAFARLRALVDEIGTPVTFPVECRWVAGDDIPLSPTSGRDSAYLAVHMFRGQPYDRYFQAVEAIMDGFDGRPHWGKLHFQSAATLAPRYGQWGKFVAARGRIDPEGRFGNTYTDRILGPLG